MTTPSSSDDVHPAQSPRPGDADDHDTPRARSGMGLTSMSVREAITIIVPIVCVALLATMYVRYNPTPSVAPGLYVRLPFVEPEVGDYAFACLEGDAAQMASEREYVPASWFQCEAGLQALLKRVVAVSGDTVVVERGRGFLINGKRVAPLPPEEDSEGRPVPLRAGTHVLSAGEYWLASTAYMGFDSRVFGPVSQSWLRGRAVPVWTRPVPLSMAAPPGAEPPVWVAKEQAPLSRPQSAQTPPAGQVLPPSEAESPTEPLPQGQARGSD